MQATDLVHGLRGVLSRAKIPARILRNKVLGKDEPTIAFLIVNNGCNLKCTYCFGDYPARDIPDFTTDECLKIVDELYDMGTRMVIVHGGETLMRDDIGVIVDHIKAKGMVCAMVANGYFLPQKVDQIRNVDSLCISLDGRAEGNDVNRGKGTHDRIVSAIRYAKEEGFRLRVNATITSYTVNDIDYICELAREIGFMAEFCLLYKELSPRNNHLNLDDEQARRALEQILAYKKKGYPVFLSKSTLEYAIRWPTTYKTIRFSEGEIPEDFKPFAKECNWGRSIIIIDADGLMIPCFPQNESFKALNVKDVGVRKAYEHMVATNTCKTCYHLTINEYNRLIDLSPPVVYNLVKVNLRDVFQRY